MKEENRSIDPDSLVDALVSRATEKLLDSRVVKYIFFFMFGVAGAVGVGLGVNVYQVTKVSDHAAQARTEIDQSVGSLKQSVTLTSQEVTNLSTQVTGFKGEADQKVKALLEKLDSADIKNLAATKESLKSLQDTLQRQAKGQEALEQRLQGLNEAADTALAFQRLSKEIDEMKGKISQLEKPAAVGVALASPLLWACSVLLMLLPGIIGFLIGRGRSSKG